MNSKRAAHTATLIANKKVLITGGFVNGGGAIASVDVFDSSTSSFKAIGSMAHARASHTATKLPNGKVLIAGGFNGEYLDSAELYDPSTNRFEATGKMTAPRSGQIATLLNDGTILLAGGVGTGWTFLSSAEIYDPRTNSFSKTVSMTTERESHTANVLSDGRVLITGGHKGRRASVTIYYSAEIYDPVEKTFTSAGNLRTKRHKHEAILLDDGRVLVVGGSDERDSAGAYRNAEFYDPRTNTFKPIEQTMIQARYKLQGAVVKLKDGKILIAGGSDQAEVFDPATNTFALTRGLMGTNRLFATATVLGNGQVLIAGGYHSGSNNVSDGAWIFRI
ncbi:MAG: kelch repeat-containing protein [Pyrinomonadaceae bacterium]